MDDPWQHIPRLEPVARRRRGLGSVGTAISVLGLVLSIVPLSLFALLVLDLVIRGLG